MSNTRWVLQPRPSLSTFEAHPFSFAWTSRLGWTHHRSWVVVANFKKFCGADRRNESEIDWGIIFTTLPHVLGLRQRSFLQSLDLCVLVRSVNEFDFSLGRECTGIHSDTVLFHTTGGSWNLSRCIDVCSTARSFFWGHTQQSINVFWAARWDSRTQICTVALNQKNQDICGKCFSQKLSVLAHVPFNFQNCHIQTYDRNLCTTVQMQSILRIYFETVCGHSIFYAPTFWSCILVGDPRPRHR